MSARIATVESQGANMVCHVSNFLSLTLCQSRYHTQIAELVHILSMLLTSLTSWNPQ